MYGKKQRLTFLLIFVVVLLSVSCQERHSTDRTLNILKTVPQSPLVYDYENEEMLNYYRNLPDVYYENIDAIIMPGIYSDAPINCFANSNKDFLQEQGNPYWSEKFWTSVGKWDNVRSWLSEKPDVMICLRSTYVPEEDFMHVPDGWNMEDAVETAYLIGADSILITTEQPEKDLFIFHLQEGDFGVYFRENAQKKLPGWYILLKEIYYGTEIVDACRLRTKVVKPILHETESVTLRSINRYRPYWWSVCIAACLLIGIAMVYIYRLKHTKKQEFIKKRYTGAKWGWFMLSTLLIVLTAGIIHSVQSWAKTVHTTGAGPVGYWTNINEENRYHKTTWFLEADGSFTIKDGAEEYHGLWYNDEMMLTLVFVDENGSYEQSWICKTKETENGRLLNVYNPIGNVVLRFTSKGKYVGPSVEDFSETKIFVEMIQTANDETEVLVVDFRNTPTAWVSNIIDGELYFQMPVSIPTPDTNGAYMFEFGGRQLVADVFNDTLSLHGTSVNANIYAFDYKYFEEDEYISLVYKYVIDCEPGENVKYETKIFEYEDIDDTGPSENQDAIINV